ncbi:MAG: sigma-70 family RNA polymerase sigma factor [Micrococcales bacterium]|nr:sigma-70 family RNA polymerase sigma factor [Micrococcales bacterium]
MSPEEFNALFRAHLSQVSAYLARRLPESAVEEVASELFEIAWAKKNQIPEGFALQWLYKSARYLVANYHRKESGRSRILASFQEPVAAPSAEAVALADLGLSEAFSALTGSERELISLWALENLTTKEISLALEISENAAGIRLSRAKAKLKTLLSDESFD